MGKVSGRARGVVMSRTGKEIKPGDRVVMSPLGYERLVRNFKGRASSRVTIGTCRAVDRMDILCPARRAQAARALCQRVLGGMPMSRAEGAGKRVIVTITPRMAEIHGRMMAAWNAVGRREPEKIRNETAEVFYKHAMADIDYLLRKLGVGDKP